MEKILVPVFFILTPALWGGSFIAIEAAVKVIPSTLAAALRVLIASLCIAALAWAKREPFLLPPHVRWRVWINGLFAMGIPFAFLFWGGKYVPPGLGGVINGTVPLWTFLLGFLFIRDLDRFTFRKLIGVFLGLAGVMSVFWSRLAPGEHGQDLQVLGVLSIVAMAICYAIGVLINRTIIAKSLKHGATLPRFTNLLHQHLASALFLGALLVMTGTPLDSIFHMNSTTWGAVLYLACFSTALAFIMFFYLIEKLGPVRASTLTYLMPAFALFYDFLLNHRVPSASALGGAGLILAAVTLVQK